VSSHLKVALVDIRLQLDLFAAFIAPQGGQVQVAKRWILAILLQRSMGLNNSQDTTFDVGQNAINQSAEVCE
jgi:hypothetical protein